MLKSVTGFVRSSSQRVFTILLVIAACALVFLVAARKDTGSEILADTVTVRGRVTDYTGASVEGALVTFSSPGDTASAITDRNGEYIVVLNRVPTGVGYGDEKRPAGFALHQNFPNPFNPTTTIQFELDQPSQIRLDIYNITGQRVRCLVNGDVPEGLHTVVWDGVDDSGNRVGAGVYLCRMADGAHARTIRMTLVDGGGVSGGDVIRRSAGMSSKKADDGVMQRRYDIVVSKDEYETYRETGFTVSFDTSVVEKHIVMNRPGRTLPVAQAGEDCTVRAGNYVLFDASASHTANPPLKYTWYQCDSNPFKTIIITEDYFRTGELASVGFLREGVYSYYLTVTDSEGISRPDTVTVTVLPREDDCIFRDPGLEVAVRTALKNPSDPLTDDQLLSLTYLIDRVNAEKITHLDGIERCANIDSLCFGLQIIEDITPLASLTGLKYLTLDQNRILMDISPLQNLVELEYLDLFANSISDVSPLAELVNLRYLDIQHNPLVTDISSLSNLTKLKVLHVHSKIKTIDALENMIEIEELRLTNCGIEDISPLSSMTRMQSLRLYDNKYITDITPLGGMTDMYECHLSGNNISDLSPLAGLHSIALLKLSNNNISDLSPIALNGAMKSLSLLFINSNPLSDISINEYIPRLKERGVTVDWSVR